MGSSFDMGACDIFVRETVTRFFIPKTHELEFKIQTLQSSLRQIMTDRRSLLFLQSLLFIMNSDDYTEFCMTFVISQPQWI